MNELSVTEQESILALLRLGWSVRRVARETGRRHETIRRYGQQAGVFAIKAPSGVARRATAIAMPAGSQAKTAHRGRRLTGKAARCGGPSARRPGVKTAHNRDRV